MPAKRKSKVGRIIALTDTQEMNLLLGRGFEPGCFESESERKQAWLDFGEGLIEQLHPDAPPCAGQVDYDGKKNPYKRFYPKKKTA